MKLIAETAWHHQGNVDFLEILVSELVNNSRADYLKFHITIDLDEYMVNTHPLYDKLNEWRIDEEVWRNIYSEFQIIRPFVAQCNVILPKYSSI